MVATKDEVEKHRNLYREMAFKGDYQWENLTRKCYEFDLWYNKVRNEISLEMLNKVCGGKEILSIGSRGRVETELLEQLQTDKITRIDIIGDVDNNIIEANAEDMPFQDNSFDVVICRDVIEHVLDDAKAFDEIYRVLNPRGYLLITTPNAYNYPPDGTCHIRGFSPKGLLATLSNRKYAIIDKRGDVPNTVSILLTLARMGLSLLLDEFKEIYSYVKCNPNSYYTGTFLYVLARKAEAW